MIDTLNAKDKAYLKSILLQIINCKKKDILYTKVYNTFYITITTPVSREIKKIIPELFKNYLCIKSKNIHIATSLSSKIRKYEAPRFTVSIVLTMLRIIKNRSKEYLRIL